MKNLLFLSAICIYNGLYAQTVPTGTWTNTTVPTETNAALGVGTNAPEGNTEIKYCDDQTNGLVVTKRYCGQMIIPSNLFAPSYDGVLSPVVEMPGIGTPFSPPVSFLLTGYSTSNARPLIWARTENPTGLTGTSGPYTTQFMVTPYGRAGVNIENPRATFDIKGLGGANFPTLIIGRQAPYTVDRTSHIHFVNLLGAKGYNSLSQANDQGIFFTDGLGTGGCNLNGALVIAPWTETGSNIGGIRINSFGDIDLAGSVRATQLKIRVNWWGDYVFSPNYRLMSLYELERYIRWHGHLPNVPSEQDLLNNGGDVSDLFAIQMTKIEELTLYNIALQKQIDALTKRIAALEASGQ